MQEFISLLVHSNTLNFLIVAGLIVFLLKILNINKKLENSAQNIKSYVETSENEKNSAQKKLEIINSKVEKLPNVIDRIKRSTENSVKNYENKILNDIKEEKNDIEKNAKRLFNLENKKFKDKLTNILTVKSVEAAKNNAIEQLKNNRELQNIYIDMAIDELDRVKL